MICHECARVGREQPAVALCRFCMVALCKTHLVEVFRDPPAVPQYTCRHQPAQPFETDRHHLERAAAPDPEPPRSSPVVRRRFGAAAGV